MCLTSIPFFQKYIAQKNGGKIIATLLIVFPVKQYLLKHQNE